MSSSAWGAYRALGQTNLPMNWSSLTGAVNVNPLLHPTVWDSLNPHRSIAPGNNQRIQLHVGLIIMLKIFR